MTVSRRVNGRKFQPPPSASLNGEKMKSLTIELQLSELDFDRLELVAARWQRERLPNGQFTAVELAHVLAASAVVKVLLAESNGFARSDLDVPLFKRREAEPKSKG